MRHGGKQDSDMRHGYFLHSTCDMVENKGQRHATLAFLKIDMRHQDPPSRASIKQRTVQSKEHAMSLFPHCKIVRVTSLVPDELKSGQALLSCLVLYITLDYTCGLEQRTVCSVLQKW